MLNTSQHIGDANLRDHLDRLDVVWIGALSLCIWHCDSKDVVNTNSAKATFAICVLCGLLRDVPLIYITVRLVSQEHDNCDSEELCLHVTRLVEHITFIRDRS